ncbi:MAG: thymidine kinase [Chthonomonadaceae bacterium]|nr:thymidine kinase [Chthonomonadaceae bacterium]
MLQTKNQTGALTVICGSMFSGKTEELIRLVRRAMHARKKVQVFKSSLDTRCETTVIRTHDDIRFNAYTVPDSKTLATLLEPGVQVVGIEEVQFFDEGIVALCQQMADQGVQVFAAGLDQDFRGMPFSFMPQLLALADNVMKLHAICKVCGGEASRTQRLVYGRPAAWDDPTILIGADESYEARCRRCHVVRNVPGGPKTRAGRRSGNGHSLDSVQPLRPAKRDRSNGNGKTEAAVAVVPDDGSQLEMFPENEGSL